MYETKKRPRGPQESDYLKDSKFYANIVKIYKTILSYILVFYYFSKT